MLGKNEKQGNPSQSKKVLPLSLVCQISSQEGPLWATLKFANTSKSTPHVIKSLVWSSLMFKPSGYHIGCQPISRLNTTIIPKFNKLAQVTTGCHISLIWKTYEQCHYAEITLTIKISKMGCQLIIIYNEDSNQNRLPIK